MIQSSDYNDAAADNPFKGETNDIFPFMGIYIKEGFKCLFSINNVRNFEITFRINIQDVIFPSYH